MDAINISKIYETVGSSDANAHLEAGWMLLGVAPGTHQETEEAYILYSFGWPSEKGEVVWPNTDCFGWD